MNIYMEYLLLSGIAISFVVLCNITPFIFPS
jgi:hypothetical protein